MEIAIKFEPSGRTVYVLPGSDVLEAAAMAGLAVQTPCGGEGTCGKCRVRFLADPPPPNTADHQHLTADLLAAGWRLGCQHQLAKPTVLYVPPESVYGTAEQILTSDKKVAIEICPSVRRLTAHLTPPTRQDPRPDWQRLRDAINQPTAAISAAVLRTLSSLLRAGHWTVTATLADGRIADITPGQAGSPPFGAAFDIGTTTLVGTLMNLADGSEQGVTARINPQVLYGDDVIARILLARDKPAGLDELHRCIIAAVGEMIDELARQADIARSEIFELAVAGNTTMQLLFAGVSPESLGAIPFVPAFTDGLMLDAAELGLPIHPRGRVYLLPAIGGFLGGDTVAGVLAALPHEQSEPGAAQLLIDIGTNGEIVLSGGGRMWSASTAAGPAFEGARIRQGMRAAAGAIEKVLLDGDVQVNVIGNAPAVGLCGTALIDAVAGLLRAGIVDPTGRMAPPDELPPSLAPALASRVRGHGPDVHFVLTEADDERPAVALTQRDVRELQLASGAIRAGTAILLERAGIRPERISAVFLAGAFGNYIRRHNAMRIGLLPDVPVERIHFVGNASSMGAKLALLSTAVRRRAEEIARRIERVDLSADPDFQMKFADAMMFPQ